MMWIIFIGMLVLATLLLAGNISTMKEYRIGVTMDDGSQDTIIYHGHSTKSVKFNQDKYMSAIDGCTVYRDNIKTYHMNTAVLAE